MHERKDLGVQRYELSVAGGGVNIAFITKCKRIIINHRDLESKSKRFVVKEGGNFEGCVMSKTKIYVWEMVREWFT